MALELTGNQINIFTAAEWARKLWETGAWTKRISKYIVMIVWVGECKLFSM